jgi:ferritin
MDEDFLNLFISHMNAEFESYYLYLSMAGYFEQNSWTGFAKWMHLQAEEERMHAMKFYQYLLDRGYYPKLLAIKQPKAQWNSILEVFEESLKHEQLISKKINELMAMADNQKDYGSRIFLNWFIEEQIEEEASVGEIVDKIARVKDDTKGLMFLDNELGQRRPVA